MDGTQASWVIIGYLRSINCDLSVQSRKTYPLRVCELIDQAAYQWNREAVMEHLIPLDAELVLNIPLSTVHLQDSWVWHYEKSGRFSVRSVYWMLAAIRDQREAWLEHHPSCSDTQAVHKQWTQLSGVKVPSKLRVFSWRLARTSLPTGDIRKQ